MGKQAVHLAQAGQHGAALQLWERMHRQSPDHPGIALALGAALLAAGRVVDAEQWLLRCCHRHPADAGLSRLLGRALMKSRKHESAIGAFFHSLSIEPDHGTTRAELASALYWHRQSGAALPHAVRACQLELSEFSLSTYLAILTDLGQHDRALAVIETTLAARSLDRGTLMLYRSNVFLAADRLDDAAEATREVLRLRPDDCAAQHQLAASLLLRGEMTAEAWAYYEGRSGLLEAGVWPAQRLRWTDQDVAGRTVLVHAEQGLGDTLQFIRYVPLVAALGAKVIVAVQPALVRLLQGTPGAAEVISAGTLPPFDVYVPLLSLPGRFGTTLETIPPPLAYAPLRRAFSATTAPLQVGLVWAGRPAFVEDRKRSLSPGALAPLAGMPGVDFVSLQFGADAAAWPGLRDGVTGVVDFADTADRIAELDLVISVDTSVAHLAATMGKPVWLLARHNGCWRWMQDRTDSPWYPSLRLFRQSQPGDWTSVIDRVRAELETWAHARLDPITLAA